jgi:hypothetical protein
MPLPDNFALLAVNPAIRDNNGFLFLQTGSAGYIDMMLQSATGSPVNILKIASGVPISNTLYVNKNGNDSTARKETIDFPYKTIQAALNNAGANDTIEVFHGSYNVSGNLFKEGINFYFHKNVSINFLTSGRLHSTGTDTGIFNIFGNASFVNAGAAVDAFKISGGQVLIEFDSFNADSSVIEIQGVSNALSNIVFRTMGEGNIYGGQMQSSSLKIRDANVRFEGIKFTNGRIQSTGNNNTAAFYDCSFESSDSSLSNPIYQLTGKLDINNCSFTSSYPKIIGTSKSKIKNTEFNGGVITSGSSYFDSCIFDASNSALYPNSSLISNLGGHTVFSNCYSKDFNNTPNAQYTFRPSGSASGSTNFNINGLFSSFVPNFSGTNVQYGIFSYNTSIK